MMKEYPTYSNNERKWYKGLPKEWDLVRLKYISDIILSNVDKKVKDDELHIQMCNYTHVYYNNEINDSIEFDDGSCNEREYEKFVLKKNDVIITKDSETQDDNGVPTFVSMDLPDVVCGYHLSIIRSNPNILLGKYLFRLFQTQQIRDQFTVFSKGVTRYGISKQNIDNIFIPLPKIDQQMEIVEFLDSKSKLIERYTNLSNEIEKNLFDFNSSIINQLVLGRIEVEEFSND